MAEKKNLLKPLANWSKSDGGGTTDVTDTFQVSADGLTATFTITNESSYIYNNVETTEIKGHKLKLTIDSLGSSDGLAWLQVRLYNADTSDYTRIDKKQETLDFTPGTPYELEFEVPGDCGRIRICIRHEYDNDGITPAATITVTNPILIDTYTESLTALNFHKVLEENLPAKVTPGSQHVYYTTDGVTVKQFIANKEGYLIQVGGASSGGSSSGEAKYSNAYTQQWIDERKDEVLALQRKGKCITFAVATDIHVRIEDGDAGRFNQVRDYIMLTDQIPIDYICCCGDIMSYCENWGGIFERRLEKIKDIFNQTRVPWFATRGNHDYNSDDYNPGANPNIKEFVMDTDLVTARDWHKSITSKFKYATNFDIVFDKDRPTYGYFYVDDHALKHRMIFTNSEETHEDETGRGYVAPDGTEDYAISGVDTVHQINFIVNEAMDMTGKEDWQVSFYSHTAPYTDAGEADFSEFHAYGGNNPDLRAVIKAFQTGTDLDMQYSALNVDTHQWSGTRLTKNFSTQGPIKVIGYFSGHIHDDCYRKVDGLNVMVSTCTCASLRDSWRGDPTPTKIPPERNTSNYAMSINVFVVNTTTRTVNLVKFGSKRDNTVKTSSDLEFTF